LFVVEMHNRNGHNKIENTSYLISLCHNNLIGSARSCNGFIFIFPLVMSSPDQGFILVMTRTILLRMRNVSDKNVEELKTHIVRLITFFLPRKSYRM
jgi:hypothetical protein